MLTEVVLVLAVFGAGVLFACTRRRGEPTNRQQEYRWGWQDALSALYCEANKVEAGQDVHAAWRDAMLLQGREVPAPRMHWDTLSPLDHQLDEYIAQQVIRRAISRVEEARRGAQQR